MEDDKFLGLTSNRSFFIGRVSGDPQFVKNGEQFVAFMTLRTAVSEQDANGQWVQHEQLVPLLDMDANRVEGLIRQYITDDRQLYVEGYYKSWEDENGTPQHVFKVTTIKLGSKPYVPKEQQGKKSSGPSIPG